MRYPSEEFVLREQRKMIDDVGGLHGIRDINILRSALGQPLQTYGGEDLYGDLVSKAAALCFFLVRNHPFLDGNKRIGHEMMMWLLLANEHRVKFDLEEHEAVILLLAGGELSLEKLTSWLRQRVSQI